MRLAGRFGAAAILAMGLLFAEGAIASAQTQSVVRAVRDAIARQDFAAGERLVNEARERGGVTPEMLEALSWLGRGALAAGQLDKADSYARQTYTLATAALKTRGMDDEPHLPIALGAAIEVQAHVSAQSGERSDAVGFLRQELATYGKTSLNKRIQKNINLLSLEGTRAPALDLSESLAAKPLSLDAVRGKVVVLFFWAHWCPDCKTEGPILEALSKKYASQGLVLIAPTQRYGYVAGGKTAGAEEENRYISDMRASRYSFLPENTVTLSEVNHQRYGVSTTPTLVVLDREGIVRSYHPGNISAEEFETLLQPLLAQRATATR